MAGQGGARPSAGRKSIPDHIKLVKGTFKKSQAVKAPPRQSIKHPVAPSHLNERAIYYFNIIVTRMEGRASETFTEIITTLAIRLEEVERYYTIIYETPFFSIVDGSGNEVMKNNPLSVPYKEAMRHSHTLLAEVGLTPASIGKFGGSGKEKKTDPWDEI